MVFLIPLGTIYLIIGAIIAVLKRLNEGDDLLLYAIFGMVVFWPIMLLESIFK